MASSKLESIPKFGRNIADCQSLWKRVFPQST